MLEEVKRFENSNFSTVNNKVIKEALKSLNDAVSDKKVQDSSLDSSIAMLRALGSKDAEKVQDPLTAAVLKSLQKSRGDYEGLSNEDKNKLIQLTDNQRDRIKQLDSKLRESYLKKKVTVNEDSILANKV